MFGRLFLSLTLFTCLLFSSLLANARYGSLPIGTDTCPGHGQFYRDNFCWLRLYSGCNLTPEFGVNRILRGGLPSLVSRTATSGIDCLAHQGVGLIIDLRSSAEDPHHREARAAAIHGMIYKNFPMTTENQGRGAARNRQAILGALPMVYQFLLKFPRALVFVHCAHGEDRTGLFIAAYRRLVEHTPRPVIWQEMLNHRYGGQADLQNVWQNIDGLAKDLDLTTPVDGI